MKYVIQSLIASICFLAIMITLTFIIEIQLEFAYAFGMIICVPLITFLGTILIVTTKLLKKDFAWFQLWYVDACFKLLVGSVLSLLFIPMYEKVAEVSLWSVKGMPTKIILFGYVGTMLVVITEWSYKGIEKYRDKKEIQKASEEDVGTFR